MLKEEKEIVWDSFVHMHKFIFVIDLDATYRPNQPPLQQQQLKM